MLNRMIRATAERGVVTAFPGLAAPMEAALSWAKDLLAEQRPSDIFTAIRMLKKSEKKLDLATATYIVQKLGL
ncbi:MAG: hypothetical protein LBI84_03880 [Propionibacteriaceae bacterium]|jgi:hypothetical protein|nr:hypothetical protein [Propionibacteriaceae bacterium]